MAGGGVRRRAVVLLLSVASGWLLTGCDDSAPTPTGGPASAPAPAATVAYAPGLTEDLYLPAEPGPAPLVVLVPGGGWTTADPSGLAGLAGHLAGAGIVAATVHIRAAVDRVVYPVPVEDVLCAVATAAAEARSRGSAPTRVAVLGHSSGAHLAALAVLAFDDYAPTCAAPLVAPGALIGLAGPYDISRVPGLASALLGSAPAAPPAAGPAARPRVGADLRPEVAVLLMHGEDDDVVPVDFTTQFADVLESAGHPTTVELVPGADHLSIFTAEVAGEAIAAWLRSS